ncbi:sensor histidine kinase [Streptomyces sp. NPDC048845]|uniref:sensor histidine kinase n=1 Tax=Streptomyces sp. NPDC048845 TaxID=3155390 RepID=UPI003432E929
MSTSPQPARGRTEQKPAGNWFATPAYAVCTGAMLTVGAAAEVLRSPAPGPLTLMSALVASASMVWRRAHPAVTAHLATLAAFVNFFLWPQMFLTVAISGILGFYALARYRIWHPVAVAVCGVAATVVVNLGHIATGVFDGRSANPPLGAPGSLSYFAESFLISIGIFAAVSVGDAVHGRDEARRERAVAQTELIRLERQKAAEQERLAIARELHDIISHSVSVIAVQAESATYTTPDISPQAREGFQHIAASSREALNELRQLLNVLRSSDTGSTSRVPQPTLGRLDELLAQHRAGGDTVRIEVSGTRQQLPAFIELTAFRIVQEALTNVRRHAPGTRADVGLHYRDDHFTVRISNDGPRPSPAPTGTPGHGLAGMQERVTLVGGSLHYGRGPAGGFVVEAKLPNSFSEAGDWMIASPPG